MELLIHVAKYCAQVFGFLVMVASFAAGPTSVYWILKSGYFW